VSSEYGTHKTDTARFWPWLSGEYPQNVASCSLFARKRTAHSSRAPFRRRACSQVKPRNLLSLSRRSLSCPHFYRVSLGSRSNNEKERVVLWKETFHKKRKVFFPCTRGDFRMVTLKPQTLSPKPSAGEGHQMMFRSGFVFKAHRLVYHSPLGFRVIKNEIESFCGRKCVFFPCTQGIFRLVISSFRRTLQSQTLSPKPSAGEGHPTMKRMLGGIVEFLARKPIEVWKLSRKLSEPFEAWKLVPAVEKTLRKT